MIQQWAGTTKLRRTLDDRTAMEQRVFFKKLFAIASSAAGINLKEGKEALVVARLGRRLRALGIQDTRQYLQLLENDASGEELEHYIDSIATNFTSFFREKDHFALLQEKLKEWQYEGKTRLRFWSAACSTGEEPYTLAMAAHEVLSEHDIDWKILASDISSKALNKAIAAEYDDKSMKNVPIPFRAPYFRALKEPGPRGAPLFEVAEEIRSKVTFARINLSKPPFPMRGPLDVIFCRNVMIYFTHEVRQHLIREMERLLASGGILFTGHSESLTSLSTILKPLRSSMYIKP